MIDASAGFSLGSSQSFAIWAIIIEMADILVRQYIELPIFAAGRLGEWIPAMY